MRHFWYLDKRYKCINHHRIHIKSDKLSPKSFETPRCPTLHLSTLLVHDMISCNPARTYLTFNHYKLDKSKWLPRNLSMSTKSLICEHCSDNKSWNIAEYISIITIRVGAEWTFGSGSTTITRNLCKCCLPQPWFVT